MALQPQLFVSLKNAPDQVANAFRQIEQWAAQVVIQTQPYASLTGAGQTTTPGALTQAGGFTVNDNTQGINIHSTSTSAALLIQSTGTPGAIGIQAPHGFVQMYGGTGAAGNGVAILGSTAASASSIGLDTTGLASGIQMSGGTSGGGVEVGISGDRVSFYGSTPSTKLTVTGSRGGNAALASLLTALNTLGLITDSSTP